MAGDKFIQASPGPDYALRQSDAEEMNRAMRGATTSRATAIARRTAEREIARNARSKGRRGKRSTRR